MNWLSLRKHPPNNNHEAWRSGFHTSPLLAEPASVARLFIARYFPFRQHKGPSLNSFLANLSGHFVLVLKPFVHTQVAEELGLAEDESCVRANR